MRRSFYLLATDVRLRVRYSGWLIAHNDRSARIRIPARAFRPPVRLVVRDPAPGVRQALHDTNPGRHGAGA